LRAMQCSAQGGGLCGAGVASPSSQVTPHSATTRNLHVNTPPPQHIYAPTDSLDQLWRAADRSGSSHVNFVPTHHWLSPSDPSGSSGGVGRYCMMAGTTGANKCYGWSDALVGEFRDAMRVCFAEAINLGLTISVRPHLDDGTGSGAWRNGLLFEPAERYGGASYHGELWLGWVVGVGVMGGGW